NLLVGIIHAHRCSGGSGCGTAVEARILNCGAITDYPRLAGGRRRLGASVTRCWSDGSDD
ncbi:hypothetical protein, partial [Schaalia vaccimaxillae]|uniref:hypothetical protein n=1 Tax=Schaalia vaccimaxillae TaxID=183916 RepID=UPI001A94A51C